MNTLVKTASPENNSMWSPEWFGRREPPVPKTGIPRRASKNRQGFGHGESSSLRCSVECEPVLQREESVVVGEVECSESQSDARCEGGDACEEVANVSCPRVPHVVMGYLGVKARMGV